MVMEEQESDMELASERVPVPVPRIQQPKLDAVKRNNKSSVSRGKPRLRKKALHAMILKQMEFYFSDANLSKDRYLSELLKKSPYVDLDIFTNFNKLSVLTTDINRIAKALQKSTMLKVSEDGTKVYRVTPINKKENIDDCTVYVQNLPLDADHDWLISVFSKYGPVVYVSIPRYKSNKKIKGFAFVEFDTTIGAKACIKAFQEKGCVLPSHTSPNDLLSITTFDDTKKNVICDKSKHLQHIPKEMQPATIEHDKNEKQRSSEDKIEDSDNAHDDEKITDEANDSTKRTLGKRKLSSDKSSVTDESNIKVKRKKIIADQNIINQKDDGNDSRENEKTCPSKSVINHKVIETDRKKKRRLTINDTFVVENIGKESIKKDMYDSATIKSDKNRTEKESTNKSDHNRSNEEDSVLQTESCSAAKDADMVSSDIEERGTGVDEKKKKKNRKKRSKIQEDIIFSATGVQVMAKRDWKSLRNKYLELQRSQMQQLKLHLKKARWNYDKAGQSYGKSKHEKNNGEASETAKTCYGRISYAPGIIVKMEMDEPCTDPNNFKTELRNNNCVKYIDVTYGSHEAYIRCDTAEAAQEFVQKSSEGKHLTILKGDEEKLYWDKIEQNRKEKLSNKKAFRHRGRDKLLKRAEKELGKCIKFDQV